MSLQGNLHDFPLSQLLNLIHLALKSGMLELKRADESVKIWFREGKLAYVQSDYSSRDLIAILQHNGNLNHNQVNALQKRFGQLSDKEMGLHLVNASYLTQQDILDTLESEYSAAASRIFYWTEGDFQFDPMCFPPEDKISVRMDLDQLILEFASKLEEARLLQAEIPDLDVVLKFFEHPDTRIHKGNLNSDEWKVVSQIDAIKSIRQIGKAVQISEFEIRRTVSGLLQARIVEYLSKPKENSFENSQAI